MKGISIQERYDDIVKRSGFSEDVVRQVLKVTRQSLVDSLKKGERATLPGICTITAENRYKMDENEQPKVKYIKLKASPSSSLETLVCEDGSVGERIEDVNVDKKEEMSPALKYMKREDVRVIIPQIASLL